MKPNVQIFAFIALLAASPWALAISEKQIQQFVASIEKAPFQECKTAQLDSKFNVDEFIKKVNDNFQVDRETQDAVNSGMRMTFQSLRFGRLLCNKMGGVGSYKYLGSKKVAGRHRALFRMTHSSFEINYHELLLSDKNNEIVVDDIYVYLSGEWLSETMRDIFVTLLKTQDKSLFDKLSKDNSMVENLSKIREYRSSFVSRQYQTTIELYEEFPESLKAQKSIKLIRVMSASQLNDKLYKKVLKDYEKHFAGDPSLSLVLIDSYFLDRKFPALLSLLDKLDKQVHDPYLDHLRGSVYQEMKKFKMAKAKFKSAISRDPDTFISYGALIELGVREKNNQDILHWSQLMGNRFDVDLNQYFKDELFQEFVKSDVYKDWKAEHP